MKWWRKWKIFIREISCQFFLFILSLNSIHCISSSYNPFNLISELMQNWWSHQDKFYIYIPFAQHNAYITIAIQMYRNLNVFTKNDDCVLHARTYGQMNRQMKVNSHNVHLTESLFVSGTTAVLQKEKRKRRKVKSTNVIGRLSFHDGEVYKSDMYLLCCSIHLRVWLSNTVDVYI